MRKRDRLARARAFKNKLRAFPEPLETRLAPATGSIQGTLWHDYNSDGVRGSGDSGIGGRTVFLDTNANGQLNSGETTATTAADGSYSFNGLAAGTYNVGQVLPGGWAQTSPVSGADRVVTVNSGTTTTFDFQSLAGQSDIPAYTSNGYTFTTSDVNFPNKFQVINPSVYNYAGSIALTAEATPVTISLKKTDNTAFSLSSMDISEYRPSDFPSFNNVLLTFTGTRADGSTVQQSFQSDHIFGFQTVNFTGFTNLVKVSWPMTYIGDSGTDFHQFDNVVVQAGAGTTVSGVDFGSVNTLNAAPTAANDAYNVNQNASLNVGGPGVLANDSDPDGDPIKSVIVSNPVHGSVTLLPTGAFTYIPASNYSGPDSFTYKVNDGALDSKAATVSITVKPLNSAPGAQNDNYGVTKDTPLVVSAPGVLANDTDAEGDPLTASFVAGPSHGTVSLNADGSFTYTPASKYLGPDQFSYRASDGKASSTVAYVNLTVTGPDDAPFAEPDFFTTAEDTPIARSPYDLLANDGDPNGQPLQVVPGPGPSHGTVSWSANGFSYTPAANYNGYDVFSYRVTDGSLYSDFASITINVTPVNDAPTAVADTYTVAEDGTLNVAAPGVLANDVDPDGDTLYPYIYYYPSHGYLNYNADGSFSYTPTANYNGPDTFSYQLYDGHVYSNVVTDTITVTAVDDAPVAANDEYTIDYGTTLVTGAVTTSLAMQSDPGDYVGAGRTYNFGPGSGVFGLSGANTYITFSYHDANYNEWWYATFSPPQGQQLVPGNYPVAGRSGFQPAGQAGLDVYGDGRGSNTLTGSFTIYQAIYASDGHVLAFAADFIQHSEGSAPALHGQVRYNTSVDKPPTVQFNDSDIDGDAFTSTVVSPPSHGTVSMNANGTFTYTPAVGFGGDDTFTYKDNDGTLDSNVATVTIHVRPSSDAPVFDPVADQVVNEAANLSFSVHATDPNSGQTVKYSLDPGAPSGLKINATTGLVTWKPADGPGTFAVSIRATDNSRPALSSATTVHITVNNVAPKPTAIGDKTGVRGQALSLTLSATDVSAIDKAAGFSYRINWGDGFVSNLSPGDSPTLTHVYNATGTFTQTITAIDKDGGEGVAPTRSIVIKAVAVQPDPLASGTSRLVVGGTSGNDAIVIAPASVAGKYTVTINGQSQGTFAAPMSAPFGRIVAYGQAGNDNIQVAASVSLPAWLDGGDGNDTVTGGAGNDVILGGLGDDVLAGNAGRDLLIGGIGADGLNGNGDDDLLIAGTTSFDAIDLALAAIMAEWTSTNDYLTRTKNLTDGSGSANRKNGSTFLVAGTTVIDDGDVDTLTVLNGQGQDWTFYDNQKDIVKTT